MMDTVATFPDLISAQLAQSLLDAEGIESSIPDEHLAGIDWQMTTALHGIRLQVAPDDLPSAAALLSPGEVVDPESPEEAAAEGQNEHCPQCGSDLMGPGRWRRRAKALTMFMPLLILLWPLVTTLGPAFECLKCGRLWKQP